jgi:enoyl-CoA hydratase/carnithine racemase
VSAANDILFDVADGLALVTLNRPAALNALTLDMIRRFHAQLDAWADDPARRRARGGREGVLRRRRHSRAF